VFVRWLVGRSVSRSVGRSVGRWVGWSFGGSVSRSVGRSVGESVGGSAGRSVGWLVDWLVSWLAGFRRLQAFTASVTSSRVLLCYCVIVLVFVIRYAEVSPSPVLSSVSSDTPFTCSH
jgi:hypothetical protein